MISGLFLMSVRMGFLSNQKRYRNPKATANQEK